MHKQANLPPTGLAALANAARAMIHPELGPVLTPSLLVLAMIQAGIPPADRAAVRRIVAELMAEKGAAV